MVMLSSVIVASLDPTRSFRGGVVAVEPVIVNAELDKERAVFGVELVPEQVWPAWQKRFPPGTGQPGLLAAGE